MSCGIPQGKDWVLRVDLPIGVSVVCYADDTLVLSRWGSHQVATPGVVIVMDRIRQLGLEVALHKSKAKCFLGPRNATFGVPHNDGMGGVKSYFFCIPSMF